MLARKESMYRLFAPMQPIQSTSRIELIDALRGFALVGILMVNMHYFAHPIEAQLIAPEAATLNRIAGWFIRLFFEGKFFPLFSFLFGLGISIQQRRAEQRGVSIRPLLYRRMIVLLLFGVAHAVLLWTGDILALYAVLGLVLITFFYRTASRTNIIWAIILLGVLNLFLALGVVGIQASLANPVTAAPMREGFAQEAVDAEARVANDYAVYAEGTWAEITSERAADFFADSVPLLFFSAPVVFAMFLLGLAFGHYRIFSERERHRPLLKRIAIVGVPLGLSLNIAYTVFAAELSLSAPLTWATFFAFFSNTVGGPILTLGYISSLTLLYDRGKTMRAFLDAFAPAGRMALTNYLMHSVIWTSVFYGYGGGLFGRVGLALGITLTLVTIGVQLPLSKWWLSHHRYGPVEWLWRRLTYGKLDRGEPSRPHG